MPSVTLHLGGARPDTAVAAAALASRLPQLLQTPSGLAILELQGTINLPAPSQADDEGQQQSCPVGRLEFPDYSADGDESSTAWMRRVYLWVGQHQRLTGEVKKLPTPLAVVRRRTAQEGGGEGADETPEELQVVELVKYKLVFSQRPEPVGGMG